MSCVEGLNITPQKHQKKLAKYMLTNPGKKSILLYHGVGTGKTITSIMIALCVRTDNQKIIVMTSKSLVESYKNDIIKTSPESLKYFIIDTYGIVLRNIRKGNISCGNNIVIIDEVHNFRNSVGEKYKTVLNCIKEASRVILLTATPIYNSTEDFLTLLSLLTGQTRRTLHETISKEGYGGLLKCNVSYISKIKRDEYYPDVSFNTVELPMSREYYRKYLDIQNARRKTDIEKLPDMYKNVKDLATFYNGIRRAVNVIENESGKIKYLVNKVEYFNRKKEKILVYSNWRKGGIEIIKKLLDERNVKNTLITGDMSSKARANSVRDYNTGNINVMLITSAGSEGISLINTRHIFLLEPHWNHERLLQVIGRGIRYMSHASLPKDKRTLNIELLLSVKPKGEIVGGKKSADQILYDISMIKKKVSNLYIKKLEHFFIEKDELCNY